MNSLSRGDVQFFNPKDEFAVQQRRLPHWSQAGTLSFITFRTHDSLPRSVLQAWIAARNDWLAKHCIDPERDDWRQAVEQLARPQPQEFRRLIGDRWHDHLDDGHGECALQMPACAEIIAASLRHFHGDRYLLTDFVVMPDHVHLIAAFASAEPMLKQCQSWKHFTAKTLNAALGRTGRFWQPDDFDHLVRSEEQFLALRQYIADNPVKAKLRVGEYLHASLPMP